MATPAKSERIQLRVSTAAKAQIVEASAIAQQDATSFILDAATSRARSVLLEQRLLKLSTNDLKQIEDALATAKEPSEALVGLFNATKNDPRLVAPE